MQLLALTNPDLILKIVCASRIPPTTWLIRAKVNSFVSFIRVEHSRKVSRLAGQLTEKNYRT